MKVQKLTLKEVEVVEVDGEFEKRFINAKTYPIFLTNAALQKGKQLGYLDTSLITDLVKLMPLAKRVKAVGVGENIDENTVQMMAEIDEQKMIHVIYLAFIGANRKEEKSFDEFIELYHLDFTETATLFMKLISDVISKDNNFAKSLEQSMKKEKKNTSHQN